MVAIVPQTDRQTGRQAGAQADKQAALQPITLRVAVATPSSRRPRTAKFWQSLRKGAEMFFWQTCALFLFLAKVFAALGWGPKDSFYT